MDAINSVVGAINAGFRLARANAYWIVGLSLIAYYAVPPNLVSKIKPFFRKLSAGGGSGRGEAATMTYGALSSSPSGGGGSLGSSGGAGGKGNGDRSSGDASREEMIRVRMRQQEILNERSKEAEKLRKEKAEKERARRNAAAQHKKNLGGNRLGDSGGSSSSNAGGGASAGGGGGGFNPMQPWNSGSGGYR